MVAAIESYGTCLGLPYELEIEAARKVVDAVPSVEMVRFTNSGSEAVGTAVRLARAYTGRRLLVRFEGHYHGWQDVVYWSNHVDPAAAGPADRPATRRRRPGRAAELADTLGSADLERPRELPAPDGRARRRGRRRHHRAGRVQHRRHPAGARATSSCSAAETRKHGALLIFDEVITGFRFCRGGGQEWFGVMPDLTTLAKGLGGGFPVAAIGGTREVMAMIAEGRYSHSGTYNANVVQCAAVSATMDLLDEPGLYARQRALGDRLAAGLRDRCGEAGIPARVEGLGTVFQLWFSEHAIRDWREAERTPTRSCSPAGARRCCCAACCSTPASTRTSSSRWCTPTRTSTGRSRRPPRPCRSSPPNDGAGEEAP